MTQKGRGIEFGMLARMDTVPGHVDRSVMSVGSLHDEPDERGW